MQKIKLLLYKYLLKNTFQSKVKFKNDFFKKIHKETYYKQKKYCFGKINPNKIFYVIKRSPGGGFFSNLIFVLKNIQYAIKKNYIPVVDMKNFSNKYSELNNLYNNNNIWDIFFFKISKYRLNEVYKSKNVIICNNNFPVNLKDFETTLIKKTFKKYIKIKPEIIKFVNIFVKTYFKKKKIIGIHLRGTDRKFTSNHYFPPSIFDIIKIINIKIAQDKEVKFFIITEEKKYLDILIRKFKNRIFYIRAFRANSPFEFNQSKRQFHRNLLGLESLKEAMILSYCHEIIYSNSNIVHFSLMLNNKIKKKEIFNGKNSQNILLAKFKWYYKVLPISYLRYIKYLLENNICKKK